MAADGRTLVKRKVKHSWPDAFEQVMDMLDGIELRGAAANDLFRVQLGVLKLCEGDIDEVAGLVDLANTDYRDVLSLAEYPEQHIGGYSNRPDLSPADRLAYEDVVARDREQYLAWLDKPGV